MKEIRYKDFSLKTHTKNSRLMRPNVCQFELTFRCGLRCKHCYTDCYNKVGNLKKELNTQEVIYILDKCYKAGVIWVCFTGGDPLTREDFLEIYSYARAKGFIVTIFTNGYSITEKIVNCLKKKPPFVIELTLNAATKELYEEISQVQGSFKKVMFGINLILKSKLPLKIKTQATKDNFKELPRIKKLIKGLGLTFRPSTDVYARLNGDLVPCSLRLSPEEILSLDGNKRQLTDDCQIINQESKSELFRCAVAGGDGIHVDPYGNTFSCNLIRKPVFNLLKVDLDYARATILGNLRDRVFTTDSKCQNCNLRADCRWCPGRAYVETGSQESPIGYYCNLARLGARKQDRKSEIIERSPAHKK
ncbi:MAG: radical SAM protein [Candidatus Omnitrophota bacterium]